MKKNFFATLVLFASLALTACGGGNGGNSNAKSTKHTHSWGEWTVTKAATCEEKGSKERSCACGEKQTQEVAALDHDWDEGTITKQATCSESGVKTFKCKREGCNAEKREEIKADHTWGEGTPVEGKDSEAAYTIYTCTVCNKAKKIEFVAKQAEGKSTIDGSLKDDSTYPDYMKLGTNGNSVTYTFHTDIGGNAKIYQRGVMDYWHDGSNNNHERNYYSGKNSTDGNFELKVNDAVVDYSWSIDFSYEDMLPGEYTGTYSPLGDALIGDCVINAGDNTIVYKRTESYNMLIKDFVIVIENPQA